MLVMNYINSQKNLYKTIIFVLALAAIFSINLGSAKADTLYYPTSGGYYPTSFGTVPASNQGYNTGNWNYNTQNCTSCGYNNQNGNNGNNGTSQTKPVVSTEAATNVGKTSALIAGAAHVDNGTANVWFEYGTRVDQLGNTTRSTTIDQTNSGSSEMLTNLSAGTKYFYRIVARNSAGTSYGSVRSFTTTGGAIVTSTKTNTSSTTYTSSSSYSSDSSIKGNLSASAANAGSSSGVFPSSIFGWLIIILLVFAIAAVVRMIQREAEEKKKIEEAKNKLQTA